MNAHASLHLPLVPIAAAAVGLALIAFTKPAWLVECGKALLWGGAFAALFASSGSC
jgi:hypothetical protein